MRLPSWSTILVFAVVAIMLTAINARPALPDPDSFYHAKMALMIRDNGFVHAFPWLQETTLRESYVDMHLLYHLILIPFVTVFDPMVGMRISAVLFGILSFYSVYRLIKSIGSPFPEWLVLAGVLTTEYAYRMSMPRAPSLSVVFLTLGIWAIFQMRSRALFFVTLLFVWTYHGWPVLVAAFGCVLAASFLTKRKHKNDPIFSLRKPFLAMALGVVSGLALNPYFPANVGSIFSTILKYGVLNGSSISAGTEWNPVRLPILLFYDLPAFAAVLFSLLLFYAARKERMCDDSAARVRVSRSMLLLLAFFAFFSIRSARYVEYLYPVLLVYSGTLLARAEPFIRTELLPYASRIFRWRGVGFLRRLSMLALALLFGYGALRFGLKGMWLTDRGENGYFQASQYEGSANWLRENLPAEAVIYNNLWDSSMLFFYLNDTQYSLVGIDPRFMVDRDPYRYFVWREISKGRDANVEQIQSLFHASAVLIDKRFPDTAALFAGNLETSGLYKKAYEDEWTNVYVPVAL